MIQPLRKGKTSFRYFRRFHEALTGVSEYQATFGGKKLNGVSPVTAACLQEVIIL